MATIGTGLLIVVVLWSIALAAIIVLCSSQGNIKYMSLLPTVVAAIVTIILITLPSASSFASKQTEPPYMYSYTSLIWILLLSVMCLTLVASLLIYFVGDIMSPRYAKVSKMFTKVPR